MPKFLTRDEIYRIIQRELPEDAYATSGVPGDFYTTSDDDAFAKTLETSYESLSRVYDNYFPGSADEFISKWEVTVFGEIGNAASGLEQRRDRILTKLRSRKGITKADIQELVQTVIGSDKLVEIIEFSSNQGSWILGESELGLSTFLGGGGGFSSNFSGPDLWEKTASELGVTEEQLEEIKAEAYGYTIRIINYEATDAELAEIERLLDKYEPARSWHQIENNATLEEAKFEWLLEFSELGETTYL